MGSSALALIRLVGTLHNYSLPDGYYIEQKAFKLYAPYTNFVNQIADTYKGLLLLSEKD